MASVAILWILWLVFGIASAMIAKDKNRSFGYFFVLGLLLGPIGLIIASAGPSVPVLSRPSKTSIVFRSSYPLAEPRPNSTGSS